MPEFRPHHHENVSVEPKSPKSPQAALCSATSVQYRA
jgi:hypothetical protein